MKHLRLAALMILVTVTFGIAQSTSASEAANSTQKENSEKGNVAKQQDGEVERAAKRDVAKEDSRKQNAPVTPAPIEPTASGEPHTEMLDTANAPAARDPLLEPKPLPKADLSLIGGIAKKVDVIHNRISVEPFGGGNRYVVYFDERTRILNNGRETTILAVRPGSRVYVDTQALGAQVFAKTIQVRGASGSIHASGQVIENFGGQVRLEDRLSGEEVRFAVSDQTKLGARDGRSVTASDIHSGSLIDVIFTPGVKQGQAQSITILASPGESYVFAGTLTHVDVRDGVLALDNQVDGNNYELYFDPKAERNAANLVVGTSVSVTAHFDGKRYKATSIDVMQSGAAESNDKQ